ncbi:hypothetical protein SNE40_017150 [Patella caerulea]|uniref:Uncharacterized protein n=1 Tax=Patella caerulea TaxID=87958 RepID=A0AAN8J9W5_PATCE
MFSWLKKRCRRRSAPSDFPNEKRIKSEQTSCGESRVPSPDNLYFTLEDESDYHIYEDIDDIIVNRALINMTTELDSQTSKLQKDFEDEVWLKRTNIAICSICRGSQGKPCDCVTSDLDLTMNSPLNSPVANKPLSRIQRSRRTLQGHEIARHSTSLVYDLMAKRRHTIIRSTSDIQDRPLPAVPVFKRVQVQDNVISDDDSSGYYETMESDSDFYEEIPDSSLKCTTV